MRATMLVENRYGRVAIEGDSPKASCKIKGGATAPPFFILWWRPCSRYNPAHKVYPLPRWLVSDALAFGAFLVSAVKTLPAWKELGRPKGHPFELQRSPPTHKFSAGNCFQVI